MARVSTFIYCEDVRHDQTPQGMKLNVQNPYATLLPAFVPGNFTFNICFGIEGMDLERDLKLRYTFGPSNEADNLLVDSNDISLKVERNPETLNIPDAYQGVVMTMEFKNIIFRKNGEYVSKIYLDDKLLGEFPIMVHGRESLL